MEGTSSNWLWYGISALVVGTGVYIVYASSASEVISKAQRPKVSKKSVSNNKKKKFTAKSSDSENDDDEVDYMKGYKTTKTGGKTSYFTRELPENTITVDNTPKKIDAPSPVEKGVNISNSSSKWNSLGTYEERNFTSKAHEIVKTLLENSSFSTNEVRIVIWNIRNITGDATTSFVRNKKKYIYDLSLSASWQMEINETTTITGSVDISDISADQDYDYKILVDDKSRTKGTNNDYIDKYIKSNRIGLQQVLNVKLNKLLDEFSKLNI